MPAPAVKRLLPPTAGESPWAVLSALDRAAKHLQVSISALIPRIGLVHPSFGPYVFICSRFTENRVTGLDPQLRVATSCGLGLLRQVCVWNNHRVFALNMWSGLALFNAWRGMLAESKKLEPGCYTWDENRGLTSANDTGLCWRTERVNLDFVEAGRWRKGPLPLLTAHRLYAWGGTEREGYVLSVLRLPHSENQGPGKG